MEQQRFYTERRPVGLTADDKPVFVWLVHDREGKKPVRIFCNVTKAGKQMSAHQARNRVFNFVNKLNSAELARKRKCRFCAHFERIIGDRAWGACLKNCSPEPGSDFVHSTANACALFKLNPTA